MTFMDAEAAASRLGVTRRHFHRKYVDSGKLKPIVFRRGPSGKPSRMKFLTAEVERLAKGC